MLALLLEAALIGLLLMIGMNRDEPLAAGPDLVSFDVESAQPPNEAEAEPEAEQSRPQEDTRPQERPDDPREQSPTPPVTPQTPRDPAPAPQRPRMIELSPDAYRSSDISRQPSRSASAPAQPAYGPPGSSSSSDDTPIVGTAPNGEPMYAARWFREPSDAEMRGYLSTANPDSWALITCRTAPRWRVEDCVGLEEFPQGSNVMRSALAAAWQFQVRPPRKGNQSLVGSWVRIRISYERS